MPRKPFYNKKETEKENSTHLDIWKCVLYIRLSREDGDKAESDSIVNQRKLLVSYVEEHEEFRLYETYIDEDYTGTNFNRPAFMQILKDIKCKKINCVIVKDLSRFGRDYLGAGNYLENIFPSYNCRFISVLDDLDSYVKPDEITGLMVRIKSLIHDQNSQDISKKVRAAKDMLRKDGKFTDGNAPYGYYREPSNKHKLLIDKKAADIVRMIFDMYLSGMGVVRIAQKLSRMGIAPCSVYKRTGNIYLDESLKEKKSWPPRTVRNILSNKTYIGALDQRKQTTRNYKDKKAIYLDEKEHIIVHNVHMPIIPKEKFDLVQHEFATRCTRTSTNEEKVYPLSGYLRCGECGYAMKRNPTFQKGRWYVYYVCKSFHHHRDSICKHSRYIKEEKLYDTVLKIINLQIRTLVSSKLILERINEDKSNQKIWFNYNKIIRQKEKEVEKCKQLRLDCYVDWKNNNLSKEEYLFSKGKFDKKIETLKKDILKLKDDFEKEEEIRSKKLGWLDSIIKYGEIKELSREIIVRLVDMVYITQGNEIKIVFKYADKFEKLKEYIEANTENEGMKERYYAAE
jgi:DNA invertase Pin-like site-specific DNA recombinase